MAAVGRLARISPGLAPERARRARVGGCDALELARDFGTPAYVYAEDDMRARARGYLEAFRARAIASR